MCVCLQLQLAEMEARVVGAETRAEIAEEKVNVIRFCWVFWLGFCCCCCLLRPPPGPPLSPLPLPASVMATVVAVSKLL